MVKTTSTLLVWVFVTTAVIAMVSQAGALSLSWQWNEVNTTTDYNFATVVIISSDFVNCTLYFDDIPYPDPIVDVVFFWYFDNVENGNHTTDAICDDLYNTASIHGWWNVFVPDETPPVLTWDWLRNITSPATNINVRVVGDEELSACTIDISGSAYMMEPESEIEFYYGLVIGSDGNYTLRAQCNDTAGNVGYTTWAWYNLQRPPMINWFWSDQNTTISVPDTTVMADLNKDVSVCVLEWDGVNETMEGNGRSWQKSKTLTNGNYTLRVYCTDFYGNTGLSTTAWVDVSCTHTEEPPLVITWGAWLGKNSTTDFNTTTVTWTTSKLTSQCTLIVNGVEHQKDTPGTSFSHTLGNLANGNRTLQVRCSNSTSTRAWWYVSVGDFDGPTIALNSPADNHLTNDQDITFSFTAVDDESATLNCRLFIDGKLNATMTAYSGAIKYFTIYEIPDGSYEWFVRCADSSSNEGASPRRDFICDSTPPTIELEFPEDDSVVHGWWTIEFDIDDSSHVTDASWTVDGNAHDFSSKWSIDIEDFADEDGVYEVLVSATDDAGNTKSLEYTFMVDDSSPDLEIEPSDISFSPKSPDEGDEVTMGVEVHNLGYTDSGEFEVELYIDGDLIGTSELLVRGNGTNTTEFVWEAEEGKHTVAIEVDADDDVDESIETNNNASRAIDVDEPSGTSDTTTKKTTQADSESDKAENRSDETEASGRVLGRLIVGITGSMEDGNEITVIVVDGMGNRVEGANVSYGSQQAKTNAEGKATLIAVLGLTGIGVSKEGYGTSIQEISVGPKPLLQMAPEPEPKKTVGEVTSGEEFPLDLIFPMGVAIIAVVAFLAYRRFRSSEEPEDHPKAYPSPDSHRNDLYFIKSRIKGN
jgi:hypothetical protein